MLDYGIIRVSAVTDKGHGQRGFTMARGYIATVEINGESLRLEGIGHGHFSTAYLHRETNNVYLYTKNDPTKEMIAQYCEGQHIPVVEYVTTFPTSGEYDIEVYKMPFYRTIAAKDTVAWAVLKELIRVRREAVNKVAPRWPKRGFRWETDGIEVAQYVADNANVPDSVKEALTTLVNGMRSYGDSYTFEFAKRNVAVDENGDIILRDVCFDTDRV
jgi:hypothetical protein